MDKEEQRKKDEEELIGCGLALVFCEADQDEHHEAQHHHDQQYDSQSAAAEDAGLKMAPLSKEDQEELMSAGLGEML
eukprot:jgi/Chlat1/2389/Chrsp17S02652